MVTSVTLFNAGMVVFFLSFLFYTIYTFSKSEKIGNLATALAWIGIFVQGAAFVVRGIEKAKVNMVTDWTAFYKYAPFTNMYESLMLFGWTAVFFYLLFEWKYRNKVFGMFVLPLALMGELSTQILGFDEQAHPLVPALQSNWLLFHVVTTFIGYAAAAVSAGMAYLYFCKERNVTLGDWIYLFTFTFYIIFTVILYPFKPSNSFILSVYASGLVGIVLSLLIAYLILKYKKDDELRFADFSGKVWGLVFLISLILSLAVFDSGKNALITTSVSLLLSALIVGTIYLVRTKAEAFSRIVPSTDAIEQIMYQSVAVGFVFLTIGIILGAVWAKYAWGGYWSWDPKETWSLITWLVYAAYLHARYIKGLSGKPLVYFTVIGFLSVMFTYYGVNLIIPGLHSYAQ